MGSGCAFLLPLHFSCPSPKLFAYLDYVKLRHPRALWFIRVLVPQKGGLVKEADAFDMTATCLQSRMTSLGTTSAQLPASPQGDQTLSCLFWGSCQEAETAEGQSDRFCWRIRL